MSRKWRIASAIVMMLVAIILIWIWPELFVGALLGIVVLGLLLGGIAFFWREKKHSRREVTTFEAPPTTPRRYPKGFPWGWLLKWAGAILIIGLAIWLVVALWPETEPQASEPPVTPSPVETCNSVIIPLSIGKEEKISAEARQVTFSPINGCVLVKAYDMEDELLLPEYQNCSDVKGRFQVPGGAGYRIVRPDPTRPASGLCVKS